MVNKKNHPQMALNQVGEILYFVHIYIYQPVGYGPGCSCFFVITSIMLLFSTYITYITYISVAESLFTIGVEWLYSYLCTHYYYQYVTILMYIYTYC